MTGNAFINTSMAAVHCSDTASFMVNTSEECIWWTTRASLGPDSAVLRDQICTTQGLRVNCVREIDF